MSTCVISSISATRASSISTEQPNCPKAVLKILDITFTDCHAFISNLVRGNTSSKSKFFINRNLRGHTVQSSSPKLEEVFENCAPRMKASFDTPERMYKLHSLRVLFAVPSTSRSTPVIDECKRWVSIFSPVLSRIGRRQNTIYGHTAPSAHVHVVEEFDARTYSQAILRFSQM